MAEVRGDEIIGGDSVVGEVARKFGIRTNVSDAVSVGRIVGAGDVVEVNEGVVLGGVRVCVGEGKVVAGDVLLVGPPRNAGVVQQCDQVIGGRLMIGRGRVIVG